VFVNTCTRHTRCGQLLEPVCANMCIQVSSPLIRRVTQVDTHFVKELEFEPRVASEFDFQLDCDAVLQGIHAMDFFELKGASLGGS